MKTSIERSRSLAKLGQSFRGLQREMSWGGQVFEYMRQENAGVCNIVAMISLKTVPTRKQVYDECVRMCKRFPRFTKTTTLNKETNKYEWELIKDFDANDNIAEVKLSDDAGMMAGGAVSGLDNLREAYLSDELRENFEEGRALWFVKLVTYTNHPGCDLVYRISHAIGDGMTLASLLVQCFTPKNPNEAVMPQLCAKKQKDGKKKKSNGRPTDNALCAFAYRQYSTAKYFWKFVKAIGQIGLDPFTPLVSNRKADLSGKILSWSKIPLADLKTISKHFKVTINDVMMSAHAGQIYRFLKAVDHTEMPHQLTTKMVMNMRMVKGLLKDGFDSETARPGNDISVVMIRNQMKEMTARERLEATRQKLDEIKNTPEAPVTQWVWSHLIGKDYNSATEAFNQVDANLEKGLTDVSTSVSNVMGPRSQLLFAGQEIDNIFNCVNPMADSLMSLMSYMDTMNVSITSSHMTRDEIDLFRDCLQAEIAALLEATKTEEPLSYGGCSKLPYVFLLPFSFLAIILEGVFVLTMVLIGLLLACTFGILCLPCLLCRSKSGGAGLDDQEETSSDIGDEHEAGGTKSAEDDGFEPSKPEIWV